MDQEELSESVAANESPVVASQLTSSSTSLNVEVIPEKAHHPEMFFSLRTFGKQKRSFCLYWFQKYPWLHYQEGRDVVLCFYCHVAERRHLPISPNKDEAFIKLGFSNWKKSD